MDIIQTPAVQRGTQKAQDWLISRLSSEGSLQDPKNDLGCYYKLPYLLSISGHCDKANRVLDFIHTHFMQPNGDFATEKGKKSENAMLGEYWGYTNAWIAMAAQKMGRFDISHKAFEYLLTFYNYDFNGFATNGPWEDTSPQMDILTTAHLGLLCLCMGDFEKAIAAGRFILSHLSLQKDPNAFYLRMNGAGKLVTLFDADVRSLHVIYKDEPEQLYFMLGYPCAFLSKLYRLTGDKAMLEGAKQLMDHCLACHDSIQRFHFSHKVAWAAALLHQIKKDSATLTLCERITESLLRSQSMEGTWMNTGAFYDKFDQTAEVAIWLIEINSVLNNSLSFNVPIETALEPL